MKNAWAKTMPKDKAYLIVKCGDWEWRVLKAYQTRKAEKENQYARWMCAVKSDLTYGSFEYGDTYVHEIPLNDEHFQILNNREKLEGAM
jgi:hypothetical protein